jgi:hypothetical protein
LETFFPSLTGFPAATRLRVLLAKLFIFAIAQSRNSAGLSLRRTRGEICLSARSTHQMQFGAQRRR